MRIACLDCGMPTSEGFCMACQQIYINTDNAKYKLLLKENEKLKEELATIKKNLAEILKR